MEEMSCGVPPDLRLVLVGSQRYGAGSMANAILGGDFEWGKRTAQSVTHTGKVEGKMVQLVKAPVWLRGYHLCDTAALVKEELVLSASPGAHAFILLIEVDLPFTSACARAVKAHLELYGQDVWSHTIVLFTCADWLGSTDDKEYISGEGEGLKELLKRCGQRYVFDRTDKRETLSERLLNQVQMLLSSNDGRPFEVKENILQKIEEKREEVKKKAEIRQQQRIKEKRTQENESVKTCVGCAILGIPERQGRTKKYMRTTKTRVFGKRRLKVTVVDTPGWWKFFPANLVPSAIKCELMKAVDQDRTTAHPSAMGSPQDQCSSGRAFLLMIPADTAFTNEQRKIIEDNMRPLGETVWQNTIVVFTRAQWLGEHHIEQHIESEGDALIWLVEKCGNRYLTFCNDKTEKSESEGQVEELLDLAEEMLCTARSSPNEETRQTADIQDHSEDSEGSVDKDLKKMVETLHRLWDWGSWEIEEVMARCDERPTQDCTCDDGSMKRLFIYLKKYQSRQNVETLLKEEISGHSLEQLMKIVLRIYFRKECGAFDIVSIISESDTFKSEWKQLFEREWSRREMRLMEHVFEGQFLNKEVACSLPNQGKAGPDQKIDTFEKVSAWLKEQVQQVLAESEGKGPVNPSQGRQHKKQQANTFNEDQV